MIPGYRCKLSFPRDIGQQDAEMVEVKREIRKSSSLINRSSLCIDNMVEYFVYKHEELVMRLPFHDDSILVIVDKTV